MPGYSGLFNGVFNEDHALLVNKSNARREIAFAMRISRRNSKAVGALLDALIGAAAGGTATSQVRKVTPPTTDLLTSLGGVRPVEVETKVNRATTAADVTALKALINQKRAPSTWPVDRSGNGGSGSFLTR